MEGKYANLGPRCCRKRMCSLHTLSHLYSANEGWQSPGGWQSHDSEEALVLLEKNLEKARCCPETLILDCGLCEWTRNSFLYGASVQSGSVCYNSLAHLNLTHGLKCIPQNYDKRWLNKVQEEEDKIPWRGRLSLYDYTCYGGKLSSARDIFWSNLSLSQEWLTDFWLVSSECWERVQWTSKSGCDEIHQSIIAQGWTGKLSV